MLEALNAKARRGNASRGACVARVKLQRLDRKKKNHAGIPSRPSNLDSGRMIRDSALHVGASDVTDFLIVAVFLVMNSV